MAAATQGDMVSFDLFTPHLVSNTLRQGAFVKALQKDKAGDGKDAPEDMALD